MDTRELGEQALTDFEVLGHGINVSRGSETPQEFSTWLDDNPFVKKGLGWLMLGVTMIGFNTGRVHARNNRIGRDDSIASEIVHGIGDSLPVDVIQGFYSLFDQPQTVAKACVNQAYDLQMVESYVPQHEVAEEAIEAITNALTPEEVSDHLTSFFNYNGVEFIYNSVSSPGKWNILDEFKSRLPEDYLTNTRFDDTAPESLDTLKTHARGMVKGFAVMPRDVNQQMIDTVVLTGNVKDRSAAFAMDGLRNVSTVFMEIDNDWTPEEFVIGATVHEIIHTFQFRIIRENSMYLQNGQTGDIYGTRMPEGFKYADDYGMSFQEYADRYPDMFTHDNGRVFARSYGATDKFEHGATTVEDMLWGEGLITPDRADWGSLYHQSQVDWLICLNTIMPGFINFALVHDASRKGVKIEDVSLYDPYTTQSLESLSASLES